ncbi:uncharacterized protein LOC133201810 [Saccostrea echinata]|uniref:uncharacterized protein LOC133201810 n=1 Tax=Saccostrea echinata TaxID=191078 RepID=UPI002A810887|nr:uncharacterized protein LOC133201810 [Saccostrea echinata]
MRRTMYKYGVLIINFLLIHVTIGDPDLFPTQNDCSGVICKTNNTNHECCINHNPESGGSNESFIHSTTAAVFFVAVIGSLVTVIFMMFFCNNCGKMCRQLSNKSNQSNPGQNSTVSTVSAGVQTNAVDTPPPYALQDQYHRTNNDGVVVELEIPRCPSYVKDPPQYQEPMVDTCSVHLEVENRTRGNVFEFSNPSVVDA